MVSGTPPTATRRVLSSRDRPTVSRRSSRTRSLKFKRENSFSRFLSRQTRPWLSSTPATWCTQVQSRIIIFRWIFPASRYLSQARVAAGACASDASSRSRPVRPGSGLPARSRSRRSLETDVSRAFMEPLHVLERRKIAPPLALLRCLGRVQSWVLVGRTKTRRRRRRRARRAAHGGPRPKTHSCVPRARPPARRAASGR